jgi:chromosomal replication initiation ATPase DnaA
VSYLAIGPLYRKIEADAKRLERVHEWASIAAARRKREREEVSRPPLSAPQIILRQVARKHGVTLSEMLGPSRKRFIAHARFEAAYRLRTECRMSLPQIGRRLGGKDHTTIIHALRQHAAMHGLPLP